MKNKNVEAARKDGVIIMDGKKEKNNKEEIKRVSDYQPERLGIEEFVDIDDLLNRDITIIDFVKVQGEYDEYIVVAFLDEKQDKLLGFTTGAKVVKRKLQNVKDKNGFPCLGKIIKVKNYYDIV